MASPVPAATATKTDKIESPSAPAFVDSLDAKKVAVNESTHAEASTGSPRAWC